MAEDSKLQQPVAISSYYSLSDCQVDMILSTSPFSVLPTIYEVNLLFSLYQTILYCVQLRLSICSETNTHYALFQIRRPKLLMNKEINNHLPLMHKFQDIIYSIRQLTKESYDDLRNWFDSFYKLDYMNAVNSELAREEI